VGGVSYLVDKPVLDVFRMLGMLGGESLEVTSSGALSVDGVLKDSVRATPDVNAVATRDGHHVDVLLWNYDDDDLSVPAAKISVAVASLPADALKVEQFLMDSHHSNSYAAWQRMGSPQHPTARQFVELQQAGQLQRVAAPALVRKDGEARLDLTLERQGVTLIRLSW
jgi:xylan 1,4-beta-xylosidase